MKTVVGLFEHLEEADRAVAGLKEAGFSDEDISVLARGDVAGELPEKQKTFKDVIETVGAGAAGGGVLGGVIGSLVGLGVLTVPGLGPAFVAGSLAVTLGSAAAGAGVGAATGGLVGGILGLSIPEEEAEVYAEGVKRGGILITIQAPDPQADQAYLIMEENNALDLNTLRARWEQEGWTGFEVEEPPSDNPPRL